MNQNVDPTPTVLRTPVWPPMRRARRALMASPRPVPPWRRVVLASTWLKLWNSRPRRSAGMPGPVSVTSNRRSASHVWAAAPASSAVTRTSTRPRSVNLTALLTRLTRIWRTRTGSPHSCRGTSAATSAARARPLAAARWAIISTVPWTTACRSNGVDSSSSLPASILEKSRIWLMTPSRASATGRQDAGEAVLLGRQGRAQEQLGHADHAVEGRADLVAHVGQELALGGAGGLGRLAGGLGQVAGLVGGGAGQLGLGGQAVGGVLGHPQGLGGGRLGGDVGQDAADGRPCARRRRPGGTDCRTRAAAARRA